MKKKKVYSIHLKGQAKPRLVEGTDIKEEQGELIILDEQGNKVGVFNAGQVQGWNSVDA